MTILVSITNQEEMGGCTIEVAERILDRARGGKEEGVWMRIEPGVSRSFYVHLLKDLIVREMEPMT